MSDDEAPRAEVEVAVGIGAPQADGTRALNVTIGGREVVNIALPAAAKINGAHDPEARIFAATFPVRLVAEAGTST